MLDDFKLQFQHSVLLAGGDEAFFSAFQLTVQLDRDLIQVGFGSRGQWQIPEVFNRQLADLGVEAQFLTGCSFEQSFSVGSSHFGIPSVLSWLVRTLRSGRG
ncbi:hypothetical protein D3C76_1686440 [compost metagenome]